jgi:hypothetical protein
MMPVNFFRKFILLGMTISLLWGASTGFTAEKPNAPPVLRELDFDACEPVRYQAKISEVNRAEGTLTVAEKQIYLMDVSANSKRLSTALLDLGGKPEPLTAFKKGDLVLIEGFAHPKGFVAALKIQKIQAVTERKTLSHEPARRTLNSSRQSKQPN